MVKRADPSAVEVLRGPNIAPLPALAPLADRIEAPVLLRLGDDVSTDLIMPAGAAVLPLRSNIPAISRFAFARVDQTFATRAKEAGHGIVVAGRNYGQGSSREHGALVPRYLGVEAVLAKSFARIHAANLVNFGILPLAFVDERDYDEVAQGDLLRIDGLRAALEAGEALLRVTNVTRGRAFSVRHDLGARQLKVLAGGLLNATRGRAEIPVA